MAQQPVKSPAPKHTSTPEDAKRAADERAAAFGRVIAMLMSSPRHAKLTLADVSEYVATPIALGQFAVIGAHQTSTGPVTVAAAAWWAMVSPDVDRRLSESRDEFLKLERGEWASGDQPWIIEAIGDARIVNTLISKLATGPFKGRVAKMRAALPDGRMAVGRLEPRPVANEDQPKI